MSTGLGVLRSQREVEIAVVERLRTHLNSCVAEVRATRGDGPEYTPVKAVIRVSELELWPEEKKPCAVVACSGATGDLETSRASISIAYSVVVTIVAGALNDETATRDMAQDYQAAVRGCMMRNAILLRDDNDQPLIEVDPTSYSSSMDDWPRELRRTAQADGGAYRVWLRGAVKWDEPLPAYQIDSVIESIEIDLNDEPVVQIGDPGSGS